MPRINSDDFDLFSRELLERLGVALESVVAGSVRFEVEGDAVRVGWTGAATMPEEDFRDLWNGLGVREAGEDNRRTDPDV